MNLQHVTVVDVYKVTKGTKLAPSFYKDTSRAPNNNNVTRMYKLLVSQLKPSMVLLILIMQYSLFPSLFNYSQTLLYRHPLIILTSRYFRQFILSIGKESPYIFSKFNLLTFNTDTPLIRILSMDSTDTFCVHINGIDCILLPHRQSSF